MTIEAVLPVNQILQGDCAQVMKTFPDNCIDLTVTSPPYDNLREYKGYSFDFGAIANELLRITKQGGVLVWVVGNQVIDGDETDTAERQIIGFKEVGWRKHDTMIYTKDPRYPDSIRYRQAWEYMVVFSKDKPKSFNPIKDVYSRKFAGGARNIPCTNRQEDGTMRERRMNFNRIMERTNLWFYDVGYLKTTKDIFAYDHPAMFPEALAEDHIKSWSNEGDVILDPFAGSGTTLKAAEKLRRKWIGIEISQEYIEIAKKRLDPLVNNERLF